MAAAQQKRRCAMAALVATVLAVLAAPTRAMPAQGTCLDYELPGSCGETACVKLVGTPFSHTWTYRGMFALCQRRNNETEEVYYVFGEEDEELGMVCSETRLNCTQRTPASYDAGRPGNEVDESKPPPMPNPVPSEEERANDDDDSLFAQMSDIDNDDDRRRALSSVTEMHNMVLLIRFSDHKNVDLPTAEEYDVLFNNDGADEDICPTGSVSDFFENNFHSKIIITSTIIGWIDIDMTELEAAGDESVSCNGLCSSAQFRDGISEALSYAENTLGIVFKDFDLDDDGKVDIFTVIHSGHGAETGGSSSSQRIWSHKWRLSPSYYSDDDVKVSKYAANPGRWGSSGNDISRIGVISHEMTHFFGVPDLYDTTSASKGIGRYGLMSDAWGIDGSQRYPPSMSAWTKVQLGVVDPIVITDEGTYSITAAQDGGDDSVYRINYYDASGSQQKDYILIENRQAKGFDALLQGGLLIYHCDTKITSNSFVSYPGDANWPTYHYMVAVIQADGNYDLEKNTNTGEAADWWFKGRAALSDTSTPSLNSYYLIEDGVCSGHILSDFSASADTMTFTYSTTSQDCSAQVVTPSPTSAPTPSSGSSVVASSTPAPSPFTGETEYPTRFPTPYPTRDFGDDNRDPYSTSATGGGFNGPDDDDDTESDSESNNMMIFIIAGVGAFAVLSIAAVAFAFYRRRKALKSDKFAVAKNGKKGPGAGDSKVMEVGFAEDPDFDAVYGGATGVPPYASGGRFATSTNPRLANLQGQTSFHHSAV
ncbi:Hypothetical Protein FCC1311_083992 [Hondaea fermentalgiana]|uniref:Peptidase M6-like domain-containing protein n=1 Tax=Hondaea fermentalgiana TaxID=2315210 RepID=A0A2R5GW60_9STRA|nr:Hypothetical Protein FCC1311_083992 [Hondaea fermentalgiana]|eukprot:GBG32174.1 Hypothetical Protein FCC1311_083992 [Hondaea fermentalgiana]